MPIDVKIKKGLKLNLKGEADETFEQAEKSKTVALRPANFYSLVPKMVLKEGAKLKAGDEVVFSKYSDKTRLCPLLVELL